MAEFKDGKTSGVKDLGSDTYTSDIALSGDGKVLVYMGPEDDGVSSGRLAE
jgi:hypothetical protein